MVTERREAKYGNADKKITGKQDALTAARAKTQSKNKALPSRETSEAREAYINEVQFSGRLGKDVAYQATSGGKELAKTSLAVFNPVDREHSMWFDLVMWLNEEETEKGPANVELFQQFLGITKGEAVVVRGRLTMRLYKDKHYYTITLSDIG